MRTEHKRGEVREVVRGFEEQHVAGGAVAGERGAERPRRRAAGRRAARQLRAARRQRRDQLHLAARAARTRAGPARYTRRRGVPRLQPGRLYICGNGTLKGKFFANVND